MSYQTVNPFNLRPIKKYESQSTKELEILLKKCDSAQREWRYSFRENACSALLNLAEQLLAKKAMASQLMAEEMGKPVQQGVAEIEKCALCCQYYAENAPNFLESRGLFVSKIPAQIDYQALGVILGIMPWNFPFWQVIRFAVPAIAAGNGVVVKHSPNTYGCGELLAEIFSKAGLPEDLYTNIQVKTDQVEKIIANPIIKGVSLTGSVKAGSAVGALAGKYIKPVVLELGGSNPFIVLEDADIDLALNTAIQKMQNSGQSCIAPKRFIIHKKWAGTFAEGIKKRLEDYQPGDPLLESTKMGPLARLDLAQHLEEQVKKSIKKGAKEFLKPYRKDASFYPGILTGVKPGMPAFDEELFGPVYAISEISSWEEARDLANNSHYGLGASVFTRNP
ncbi:MAG: aldehyde dehydrogenase family protein, partial [Luteibaculum sp.]